MKETLPSHGCYCDHELQHILIQWVRRVSVEFQGILREEYSCSMEGESSLVCYVSML